MKNIITAIYVGLGCLVFGAYFWACGFPIFKHKDFKMGQEVEVTTGFYEGCTGAVVGVRTRATFYVYLVELQCEGNDVTYSLKAPLSEKIIRAREQ